MIETLCRTLLPVARQAGAAILDVYRTEFAVETKADASPVTLADKRANRLILEALTQAFPGVPVLCEESDIPPFEARRHWRRLFLVDPLDGTKEFIARNGQFTVNIALIEDGRPIYGVIYAPATDTLYCGGPGHGARRQTGGSPAEPIRVRIKAPDEDLIVLTSRSHPDPKLAGFLATLPAHRLVILGCALKFCRLAEGEADLYPRFNPTYEWDTAAGHALVLGAGGAMTAPDGSPFLYNKPDLLNGPFIAKT